MKAVQIVPNYIAFARFMNKSNSFPCKINAFNVLLNQIEQFFKNHLFIIYLCRMAKSIQEITKQYNKRFPNFAIDLRKESFLKNLNTIIVIPCHKEDEIIETLQSLANCDEPDCPSLVMIFVNASESSTKEIKEFNENSIKDITDFIANTNIKNIQFKAFINNELPTKHAGVGYARKTLMDTALAIFTEQNYDGVIINTDADCLFTKNYFTAIETAFKSSKAKHGVMHFEHRIDSEKNEILAKGITEYELHLRYYKQALDWTGYPNVMHNIGSCMICRASLYALEGGMNKRKAGEDFYFMNKLAKSHAYIEVKNASVLPSCRTSDRVPFGTGKAMNDYIKNQTYVFQTYDFKSFVELKKLFDKVKLIHESSFSEIPDFIEETTFEFLKTISFESNLKKIKKQSKDIEAFNKNFFLWFDHLKALQFIHYYTDHIYNKINIDKACKQHLTEINKENITSTVRELLDLYRETDKI